MTVTTFTGLQTKEKRDALLPVLFFSWPGYEGKEHLLAGWFNIDPAGMLADLPMVQRDEEATGNRTLPIIGTIWFSHLIPALLREIIRGRIPRQ